MIIPSTEEMADILCRIRKMNYPIKEALEDHGRMGILLVDPEENELEITMKRIRVTKEKFQRRWIKKRC